jgi:hypothetical protein
VLFTYSPEGVSHREIIVVDAATLTFTRIYSTDNFIGGSPLWRWDSGALLWPEYVEGVGGRVVEFELGTGELHVRTTDYPRVGDGCEYCVPPLVWWAEEGFAGLGYDIVGAASLYPFDATGTRLPSIEIADGNWISDGWTFDQLVPVETSDGLLLAAHYPRYDQWDVINPITGEIVPQPQGTSVQPQRYKVGYRMDLYQQDPDAMCQSSRHIAVGDQIKAREGYGSVPYFLFERPVRVYGGGLDPDQVYTVERKTCGSLSTTFFGVRVDGQLVWTFDRVVQKVEPTP